MTEQAQNIALCEWMGWKKCACSDEHCGAWFPPGSNEPELGLPPALDLNELHEMEKRLNDKQWDEYEVQIGEVLHEQNRILTDRNWIQLTATQRREALLRTLGLWREDAGETK